MPETKPATMNGKTAEEMAKEIINAATADVEVSISGTNAQKLETVVRYLNREKISARGDNWFKKNHELLVTDALETLITAREKAITEYLNKKELQAKDEAFRDLVARGVSKDEAYKQAYN